MEPPANKKLKFADELELDFESHPISEDGCLSAADIDDADCSEDLGASSAAALEPADVSSGGSRRIGLCETDVGITEYASEARPIKGILKQRYSDFVVNEISLSGEVVHLTSTDDIDKKDTENATKVPASNAASPFSADDLKLLMELESATDPNGQVKITAPADKAERTAQHVYVRQHFAQLRSSCVQEGDVKYIVVTKAAAAGNIGDPRNAYTCWPKNRPKYLHFVLYKEFKDTMEAIDIISKYSGLRPHTFTYAGTKDKRAKTTQQVAAHRVEATKLQKVNAKLLNMAVGNFTYRDEPLQLGDLSGNRFAIVLRQLIASESDVEQAMGCLRDVGFVNYFGMQRFGTGAVATYAIGKKLLCGDYVAAVELVLGERDGERPAVAAARRVWSGTHDPRATLAALPRSCALERRLVEGLARHGCSGKDAGSADQQDRWRRALECLPRGSRLMYVHSYQSYVWNYVASRRIREFGLKPVLGDLVFRRPQCLQIKNGDKGHKWNVLLLDQEQQLKDYNIYDVCLPLPGYDVMYPANEVQAWYEEILSQDNLTFDNFRSKSKDYSLPGSYRTLVVKPSSLTWRLHKYDDPICPLIQSDLDVLTSKCLPGTKSDGDYTALIVEFSLPVSSYATMALREVMRTDTSSSYQAALGNSTAAADGTTE